MTDADLQTPLSRILAPLGVTEPALLATLHRLLKLRDYRHDQPIIRAGECPTHFFVILSGLVRYYYLAPDGKQWNKAFFHEGQLIGSFSAYLKQQPCSYSIEAVEECRLAAIPLSVLNDERFPQLQTLQERMIRYIMLRNEAREALLLTCNSEQRYRWLLKHEAWLLGRVPQYQLASYLSMDAVSLSRIKRKLGG
ncbi:Crp/Fnr family transcriptional regulator [Pseudomonas sp. CrR25]|nr:Crp/Fnr family transcriptional regulator [Pseudomonas sp. CrR25]